VSRLQWSQAVAEVTFGRPIRQILLVHVGAFDAVMLEDLLAAYQHAGVTMIDLETALADPVYQINPAEGWQGESTFLPRVARERGVRIPTVPRFHSRLSAPCAHDDQRRPALECALMPYTPPVLGKQTLA